MADVEVYGKMLSTLPDDDDHPYRSGAWRPQNAEYDAARQVTGQAGDCQVEGARTFATLNIGGSLTTTVSFVVTAEK